MVDTGWAQKVLLIDFALDNMINMWPILLKERFFLRCIRKLMILQRVGMFLPPCYFSTSHLTLRHTVAPVLTVLMYAQYLQYLQYSPYGGPSHPSSPSWCSNMLSSPSCSTSAPSGRVTLVQISNPYWLFRERSMNRIISHHLLINWMTQ